LFVFALDTPERPASVKTQVRSHNADLGGDPRMVPRSRPIGTGFKPKSRFKAASGVTWPQVTEGGVGTGSTPGKTRVADGSLPLKKLVSLCG
jgi:hypothetical protein